MDELGDEPSQALVRPHSTFLVLGLQLPSIIGLLLREMHIQESRLQEPKP